METNFWICADCGQDSDNSSERCETCDAPRVIAETTLDKVVHPHYETFELDGQQIRYAPEKPAQADASITNSWLDIAKAKKEAGL